MPYTTQEGACMQEKKCSGCKKTKLRKCFHKDGSRDDGLQASCIACKKGWAADRQAEKAAKAQDPKQEVHMLLTWHMRPEFQVWSSKQLPPHSHYCILLRTSLSPALAFYSLSLMTSCTLPTNNMAHTRRRRLRLLLKASWLRKSAKFARSVARPKHRGCL